MKPLTNKIIKYSLLGELVLELIFFACFGVLYIKHNFRWNGRLIFEPRWVQDEDYIRRIGLEDKMMKDLEKVQREFEIAERVKEVQRDYKKVPRVKK